MLNSTLRRSILVAGSMTAIAAVTLTCASGANAAAAKKGATASATSATISLGGQAPVSTPGVTAHNDGTQDPVLVTGNQGLPPTAGSPIGVGVFGVAALALPKKSAACAGVLEPGGTLSIAADGTKCNIGGPRRGGLTVNLGGGLSSLPAGIGSIKLTANSVTAFSQTTPKGATGFAKIANAGLQVCAGLDVAGKCVGKVVGIPIKVIGTKNENLLPIILNALNTSVNLGPLGKLLAKALAPVLTIKSNVQTTENGVFTVTGLAATVAGGAVATLNLSVASTGPNQQG